MDGRAALDSVFLKRIIALLWSLAALADRAACAPWPVRFIVLAILRRGESVARGVVIEEAWEAGLPLWMFDQPEKSGNEPLDAWQLAMSFRVLAMALSALLALAPSLRPDAPRIMSLRLNLSPCWLGKVVRALQPHDTS